MGFFSQREDKRINNHHVLGEFHNRINNNPVKLEKIGMDYILTPYYTKPERDFTSKPTTEIEDKYIALDGYGLEGNVNSKSFAYPVSFIERYLISVGFLKDKILKEGMSKTDKRLNTCIIESILKCRWQIGSNTFLEILHDAGLEDSFDEGVKKYFPLLDLYKNIDLYRYFNEEYVNPELASKHEKIFHDLLNQYPFLKEYYDKEIEETKKLYEEVFLRMCYYAYMVKLVKIPEEEKNEDRKRFKELNTIRNRIRMQQLISDGVCYKLEKNTIKKFQEMIIFSKREYRKFDETIEPFIDRCRDR